MKIVINTCFGGFGLSNEALEAYFVDKGIEFDKVPCRYKILGNFEYWKKGTYQAPEDEDHQPKGEYLSYYDIPRNDPSLVRVIEQLGAKANGAHADLAVVEIPDDVKWHIHEYDGSEHVAEDHRTWL